MRLLDRFRRPAADPAPRRAFLGRMSGLGLALAAAGTLGADGAWAAIEERAARFGIVPGTRVDAQGRPVETAAMGVQPFIGEIMVVAYGFTTQGYQPCQGQLLSINQNQALFSLLGTFYGGNGQTTFGLPDLRGRSAVGQGQGPGLTAVTTGQVSGSESTTVLLQNLPAHVHAVQSGSVAVSSAPGTTPDPTGVTLARPASSIPQYVTTAPTGTLAAASLTSAAGGSQPFDTRDPFLALNYQIAVSGIFPSRN